MHLGPLGLTTLFDGVFLLTTFVRNSDFRISYVHFYVFVNCIVFLWYQICCSMLVADEVK
jgi:hypothetical protein